GRHRGWSHPTSPGRDIGRSTRSPASATANETLAATALGVTRVQLHSHASGLTPHIPSARQGGQSLATATALTDSAYTRGHAAGRRRGPRSVTVLFDTVFMRRYSRSIS